MFDVGPVKAAAVDYTDDERADRDPYGDARIEIDERDARFVSPGFWLDRLTDRVDDVPARLIWSR